MVMILQICQIHLICHFCLGSLVDLASCMTEYIVPVLRLDPQCVACSADVQRV